MTPSGRRLGPGRAHAVVLILLFGLGLLARLWFLDGRWVNPDEGAHLMDGRFALEGLIPEVDFGSRKFVYVYAIAGMLEVFGIGLDAGRLYPLLASLLTAGILYLLARRLFDTPTALLSTAIYLFLPFTLAYSTQVKTEPLSALLGAGAMYALCRGTGARRWGAWMAAAGALVALGYYVRESALSLLLAAATTLLIMRWRESGRVRVGRRAFALLGGFAIVVAGAMGFFARHLPAGDVLRSDANPIAFASRNVADAWRILDRADRPRSALPDAGVQAPPDAPADAGGGRPSDQPRRVTVENAGRTLRWNAFLIVGLLLSPLALPWRRGRSRPSPRDERRPEGEPGPLAAALLYPWLGWLALAYAFWAFRRGFFPAYIVEFLGPLALLFAAVALDGSRRLGRASARPVLVGFAALCILLVGAHWIAAAPSLNRPLYPIGTVALLGALWIGVRGRPHPRGWALLLAIVAAAAALVVLGREGVPTAVRVGLDGLALAGVLGAVLALARVGAPTPRREAVGFVSLSLAAGGCALWLADGGPDVDRRFDGVWSPAAVAEVASHLEARARPGDEVMSGAVIWELEAGLRPFMDRSHPLTLRGGMLRGPWRESERRAILDRFEAAPPRFVVLDGYTEQTYGAVIPELEAALADRYALALEASSAARRPVRVFERREAPRRSSE